MGESKLNFIFHNPNTEDETLKYITNIFTEIGKDIFESKINTYKCDKKTF